MPAEPPAEVQSARQAGDAARDARDWREAARQYQLHLQAEPQDFAIWVQCGHAEKEAGDLAAAERCYRLAEALRPDDADLQLQIGHLQKLLGRYREAARCYARALELDPDSADAKREVSQPMIAALLAERDAKPAPGATRPAGAFVSPSGARPIAPASGKPPPADTLLPQSDWSTAGALEARAKAASDAQRHNEAAVLLRAQVTREPTNPERWHALAEALEKAGDARQAQRCREIAATLLPD